MSLEQTVDNLEIRYANAVTFVGTSNTMIDTTTGRIQTKGFQHNSNVITDVSGPHGRGAATLKKYPEIAFESGKFDSNPTTNTFIQAGYTITSSGNYSDDVNSDYTAWRAFTGLINLFDPGWVSPFGSYTNGVANSTQSLTNIDTATSTGSVSSRNGAWIKLELPTKIKLGRVDFYDRYNDIKGTATQYERVSEAFVYGGNSNSGPWYEIGKQSDATNMAHYTDNNPASLTIDTTSYYKYYIIQPTQLAKTISYGSYGQLMFYGYEEVPPAGDHSVDTTFMSRFNNPHTTGVQVLVDGATGVGTNQISGGPDPSGNQSTYVTDGKYWTLNGTLTSNLSVEANTFLEGDQPHAVSVWFNSSNLEANVSNTCVFSVSDQEKLDSENLDLQSNTWHNLTYAYQGEGGSRVTYLDGRKVAEDQAEDTFGEYPPFEIGTYSLGGYTVDASYWNTGGSGTRLAYNIFQSANGGRVTGFTSDGSGAILDTADANYDVTLMTLTDTSGTAHLGHWVSLELPYKLSPSYCEFEHYGSSYRLKDFVILGSNHDPRTIKTGFTLLFSGQAHVDNNGTNKTIHTFTGSGKFKYLILLTKTLNSGNSTWIINRLQYYGHRENDLVRFPDPTNVLKYPHIAMTGPAQRGYVASAVEEYDVPGGSNPNYRAWEAFDDDTNSASGTGYWSSKGGAFNTSSPFQTLRSGGVFVTNVGGTDRTGLWIQLELPHKLKLNLVKYQYRSASSGLPRTGFVVGSNNGTTWEQIYAFENLTASSTTVAHPLTPSGSVSNIAYKYIRLIITHGGGGQYAAAQHIELYGTGVDSIPIQIGGGNIDKVANFRVYDKFVEEDQALEIWDAQKDEFERAKSSMTLQKGRLGIGTTEPEGRLAVADEPHNLEEFPPRAMSGHETYIEGHGVFKATADSHGAGDTSIRHAWKAFIKGTTESVSNGDNSWLDNSGDFNSTTGVYDGSLTHHSGSVSGEYLQLELPYEIQLSSYSLAPWNYPTGTTFQYSDFPRDFIIYGSKDSISWDIVDTRSGQSSISQADVPKYHVNSQKTYRYFVIVVTKINTETYANSAVYVAIGEWRLFGTREQGQSVLHDGQLTLTKNLDVPRIGPALDADDTPRRDRLVVEYNTSTNPTFEGVVRDTSGRGNDGVFVGTATYDATQKSLEFPSNPTTGSTSGTYDSIFAGDIFKRKITQHTTSLWLKPNSMGAWEQIFGIGQNASSVHEGLWISGTDRLAVHTEGSNPSQQYHYTIGNSNGKWIHITLVRNSLTFSEHTLYVNGIPLTATTTSGGTSTMNIPEESDLRIGGRFMGNDNYWLDGSISNFKLYDTALTASEVKTLYDMGRTGSVANPQPLHIAAPLYAPGTIVQVEQSIKRDDSGTSGTSASDIPGLSVTIHPKFGTSKILVSYQINMGGNYHMFLRVKRTQNGTTTYVGNGNTSGNRPLASSYQSHLHQAHVNSMNMEILDTANGTGPITYQVQFWVAHTNYTAWINRGTDNYNSIYGPAAQSSSITVKEVCQ